MAPYPPWVALALQTSGNQGLSVGLGFPHGAMRYSTRGIAVLALGSGVGRDGRIHGPEMAPFPPGVLLA